MASKSKSVEPSFRRMVLMSEDTYNKAKNCIRQEAFAEKFNQARWFEKDGKRGILHEVDVGPAEMQKDVNAQQKDANLDVSLRPDTTHVAEQVQVPAPTSHDQPPTPATTVELDELPNDVDLDTPTSENRIPAPNTKNIPAVHRKKYYAVLRKIRQSKRMFVNFEDELIIAGEHAIPNSNFHSMMRSLFVSFDVLPVAFERFVSELKSLGVKPSELPSQAARLAFRNIQQGKGRSLSKGPPGKRVQVLRVYK